MWFSKICDHQKLLIVMLACCVGGHGAAAQSTRPAPNETHRRTSPVRVASIRFSLWGGTDECSGGNELQIKPGGAALLITFSRECYRRDSHRYRDLRVDADLSDKHWHALQQLVDHDALFALPDTLGCASCYDGLDELIEVKFSDRSKKSVRFPLGSSPKEISALSEALLSLQAKLRNELPILSGANTVGKTESPEIGKAANLFLPVQIRAGGANTDDALPPSEQFDSKQRRFFHGDQSSCI
jgi:hypothetical protein